MNVPPYQQLRIPPGWTINWNTLVELDPTEENVRRGFFGRSSLFSATHEHRRLWLDLEWRPEDDPDGEYRLKVEYAPWRRTADGRRLKGAPLDFCESRVVLEFRTRDRAELVRNLEEALVTRDEWMERT